MPKRNAKAIAWLDENGEWHILPRGDPRRPAEVTINGMSGSLEEIRKSEAVFELDAEEARGRSVVNRNKMPFDEELAGALMNAIRKLEQGYSDVVFAIRELRGDRPTDVSQDMAYLIAATEQGLGLERGKLSPFKHENKVFENKVFEPLRKIPLTSPINLNRDSFKGKLNIEKMDYAQLELRIMAKAIADLGLSEWFHELMDMVCFPEVDDFIYVRDQIKEHLNDERVKFLRVGEPDEHEKQGSGTST